MALGPLLHDAIYKLEIGVGVKYLKWGLISLALVMLFVGYNWRAYRNMNTQEAMEAAQLARNLAEGKGFSTLFIRPFSIYLLTNHHKSVILAGAGTGADPARVKGLHPDLTTPPAYPLLLAGLLKIMPFPYDIPGAGGTGLEKAKIKKYFWNREGRFWWYPADFVIAMFNQMLLVGVIVLTFLLARRLFDNAVAIMSALMLLGTELLWRFSVSGLSTIFLMLIFVGLAWCLTLIESRVREAKGAPSTPTWLAAAAGLLVGIGALTRYTFAWIIIPVMLFLVLFSGPRRAMNWLAAVAVFAAVMAPWVVRNYQLSGTPFGTATYTIMRATPAFPEHRLDRSLQPDFHKYNIGHFWRKLVGNSRQIISTDLPKLGGNWTSAFFLVGLMLVFKNPGINRLRYFLLLCLPVLIVAQALGRTQLADDVPEINSENLLVLLTPLVLMYGLSLFFLLLEQIELPIRQLRLAIIAGFGGLLCLPMALVFGPPKTFPGCWPPYHPPTIQQVSNWMKPNELMMSDIPWAVAWYGHRQCVWLTLTPQNDFFAINDYIKPVLGLYMTPQTMDSKFLSQWVWAEAQQRSWGMFVIESAMRQEIPPAFPLKFAPSGFMPEQIFLTDWPRWRRPNP